MTLFRFAGPLLDDATEHVAQVAFWIQAIELGRLHQAIQRRSALATAIGAHEQVVVAPQGYTAQRPLGRGVVDLDATVIDVSGQRWPATQL